VKNRIGYSIVHHLHFEALSGHRQRQRLFHCRKTVADAHPGTATERIIRVLRAVAASLRGESLGIEALRIFPVKRIAMGEPWAHQQRRSGRNMESADLIVGDRGVADHPGRGVQAQPLVDHHPSVREARQIIEGRAICT
jgi:hypothetical protein